MSREAQFMDRFLKKRRTSVQDENVGPSHEHNQNDGSVPPPSDGQIDASPHEQTDVPAPPSPHGQNDASTHEPSSANTTRNSSQVEEINWEEEIQFDPGKRRSIDEYHPNQRDMVRRKYLANGPCQPRTADFEVTEICGKDRRFVREWFDEFGSWLEYSESKRKAYCFCCFLFRPRKKKEAGYDAFVANGWSSWNKKYRLKEHVGDINSAHNQAKRDCDALLKQKQHIYVALNNQSNVERNAYYTRLNASIDVTRVLLKQGLPFRGHDESDESLNKGNFKELHAYTAEQNPEQMAVVLRYVGKCGSAIETLVGLTHVKETTSKYLKSAIDDLFAAYKLSFKQVRGQGYDGASNMRVVKVLEYVEEEDRDDTNRRQLMSTILIITNTLSLALQQKNQDIVNAINCVNSTKASLNDLRRNGWESVLHEAYVFCDKHDISKWQMEDQYVNPKKPRQKTGITNRHHYEVDCFNDVIDWLLQELDNRFNEKNSELLVCSAALSPNESFHDFNLEHLMSLAKLYPKDFDDGELRDLRHHLHLYIADVRADDRFSGLSNIFERSFSAMRIVKTYLRNRLGDDTLKYDLICYVEKSEMRKVTNDAAIRI
nr:uncharacterized protein LOC109775849 [Aegilops tauschii subsp. strangulata]